MMTRLAFLCDRLVSLCDPGICFYADDMVTASVTCIIIEWLFYAECDFETLPCNLPEAGPNTVVFDEPLKDDLNWTIKSGPTDTEGTGPSVDHTLGTEAGR